MMQGFEPTIVILDEVEETNGGERWEPIHLFCPCSEFIALCRIDLSDAPIVDGDDEDDVECVVCLYMAELPCERCGEIS